MGAGGEHHAQSHKIVLPSDSSVGLKNMEKRRDKNLYMKPSLSVY